MTGLHAWEQTVAAFTLHAVWQAPLLAGSAWCAVRVGRPHVRVAHAIWAVTLLLCSLLPVCATVAGRHAAWERQQAAEAAISFAPSSYDGPLPALPREPAWMRLLHRHVSRQQGLQPLAFALPQRYARVLAWAWLLLLGYFLLQLAIAWTRMRRLVRASSAEALPDGLQRFLQQQCARLQLPAPPVRFSEAIAGPALAGVLRPTLLLPARALNDLSEQELRAVLLHELAHLRRLDPLWHAACSLLLLPVGFHPAAWWVSRWVGRTREMACDAEAAESMGSNAAYAHCLLRVAERMGVHDPRRPLLGFFSNGFLGVTLQLFRESGVMEERMKMLTGSNGQQPGAHRAMRAVAVASLGTVAVLAAGMLQVQPALAGERGQQRPPDAITLVPEAQQEDTQSTDSRLLSGDHAREQLRQARRDLAKAEQTANSDEDRRRIATAREMAAAAESAIAAADAGAHGSHRGSMMLMTDPDTHIDLSTMHLPDAAVLQQQMERQSEAMAKLTEQFNSPEWKAQMQRQQADAARITRELNSPEWKARMQKQQEAIARVTAQVNSPAFRAKIEAASKVDQGKIDAMLANSQEQQQRAMEQMRSGMIQRQIDNATQLMAHNEVPAPPLADAPGKPPLKVASGVMAANALQKVVPVYPPEAKEKKIQGEVLLHAIISEDGKVEQLTIVRSPDELLSKSALDAVRQWVYKPFLLNGQAVPVDTTITVNYSLVP